MKCKKNIRQYWSICLGAILLAATPTAAFANQGISRWFENVGTEIQIIVVVLLGIFGALGLVMAALGIISWVTSKKNKQPLDNQPYLIIGGVLLGLLIPLAANIGTSISGETDTQQNIEELLRN